MLLTRSMTMNSPRPLFQIWEMKRITLYTKSLLITCYASDLNPRDISRISSLGKETDVKHTSLFLILPLVFFTFTPFASAHTKSNKRLGVMAKRKTLTPIKHVIIIIGENHSFDNLFATYRPTKSTETIKNLLSEGIINKDGTPGPNAVLAKQFKAVDRDSFQVAPSLQTPYSTLPRPNTTYAPSIPWAIQNSDLYPDPGIEPQDEHLLLTGGTKQSENAPDIRFPANLPNTAFQITRYVKYSAYTGNPIHRFFQAWQQSNCRNFDGTHDNPSGCHHNLYTWVALQTGIGSNGSPPVSKATSPSSDERSNQGGVQMGFYNMSQGDVPYFRKLAEHFSLADNYHQAIMGGTGANHIAIGTGDVLFYQDKSEKPGVPPVNAIENPNPLKGSNNWYIQDGYNSGSYINCFSISQPGSDSIRLYLENLPYHPSPNCMPEHFYLVNNYTPGFHRNGSPTTAGLFIPPSIIPTIGDELSAYKISWGYYGEGFHYGTPRTSFYCNICNPFQYSKSIMTTPLRNNIKGLRDFYQALSVKTLPAISIVKPDELLDGHPASSKPDLFECFVKKIVEAVKKSAYWKSSAIFITMDESGGYYDTGYIQPLDFFGDGPRVPLLVVSPFSRGGHIDHTYYDHVSLLKFIEKNWSLPPLSGRSRDNLPNPIANVRDPYVPLNAPAIGDLVEIFRFKYNPLKNRNRKMSISRRHQESPTRWKDPG